jgi:hypothetical protein
VGSGNDYTDDTFRILIQHWDGTAWKDNPARSIGLLTGVAATSARNAWTAGRTLRWDGTAWRQVPSPAGPAASLNGVAATSPVNAWAVGSTGACRTLILHWDGTAWTQVPSPNPVGSPRGKGSLRSARGQTLAALDNPGQPGGCPTEKMTRLRFPS